MPETCRKCRTEAVEGAVFCHSCGMPLGDLAGDVDAKQRFAAALAGGRGGDDAEQILWQGRFSSRAMIGAWIGAGIATIVILIGAFAASAGGTGWLIAVGLIVALWVGLALRLFYRQISVHYFLTSQRLIHERGLLWRQIDRIETIDIDDVVTKQGPVERMLGVGTIRIRSSDQTTPEFAIEGIEDVRNVAAMIDEARRQERRRRGIHIESV